MTNSILQLSHEFFQLRLNTEACKLTEKLSPDSLQAHFKTILAGEKVNVDEDREVGHYWMRDFLKAPVGLQAEIREEIAKVKDFAAAVRQSSVTDVIMVGIGGSALGPALLYDIFGNKESLRFHFFDNIDPDGFLIAETLDLANTLVVVISKSGGTLETLKGMEYLEGLYARAGIQTKDNFVAITVVNSKIPAENKSTLAQKSLKAGWPTFKIWDFVGGRTSICSAVGLLPLALMGGDIDKFLTGAKVVDDTFLEYGDEMSVALASVWQQLAGQNLVVLPYRDSLIQLSRYLQQLIMESLGKEVNLKGELVEEGFCVFGNKGSTDQHAYVQQLRDGRNNFYALFIEVQRDAKSSMAQSLDKITCNDYLTGFLHGTEQALSSKGRLSLTLTLSELNEASLGAVIALFELAVTHYAFIKGINAYHQPGVEAGKKACAVYIELTGQIKEYLRNKRPDRFSVIEISRALGINNIYAVYRVLDNLAANGILSKESNPAFAALDYNEEEYRLA